MAKVKTYKVTAKIEFEMLGKTKHECQTNLVTLLDALVECHSNQTDCPDFFHEFTGKYPVLKSFEAIIIKGDRNE